MKKINYDQFFFNSLNELKRKGLDRYLKTLIKIDPIKIKYQNKVLLNFSSNDYLGLSQNNIIKRDTIKIIKKYGIGSGSSRLVSGNFDFHEKIENDLAKDKRGYCLCIADSYIERYDSNTLQRINGYAGQMGKSNNGALAVNLMNAVLQPEIKSCRDKYVD